MRDQRTQAEAQALPARLRLAARIRRCSIAARWLREYYERFSAFMDRFHVAGWRRWVLVEPLSEGATLGLGGLIVMLALAIPAFRETSDEDWLKKSELAVTFLDRFGNEVGSRGIRHNDAIPLEDYPDHLIKAVARDRGPALLRAFRHRSVGPRARADRQCARRRRGAGRLDDHAAARQEPVPEQRAHHRAQGEGGVPRDLARDAAHQERDPQALSRPRLYGRRRVRRGRGRAVLLQQVREAT